MGGEFSHSVPINAPEFRGLVPNISLNYNSSNISHGSVRNIVGFGWTLGGFSMIERKSLGLGVPTFDDGQDIYLLDGQALMACDHSSSTNPWTRKYPLRYLTDTASASCSAGGNLTSRVENYQRIEFDDTANTFTVTNKSGVQYLYESLGDLAGDTSASGSDGEKLADDTRWLLTEIKDLQTTPNVVTITYAFDTIDEAYAHRPSSIGYAGYAVEFHYETVTKPLGRFATGTEYLGEQANRLLSVVVKDGSSTIRGYKLEHSLSALTQTSLLSSVTEYGNDLTMSGSAISGGSALPTQTFEYSTDQVSFAEQTYAGTQFHANFTALDSNLDGSDELVFQFIATSQTESVEGSESNPYTVYTTWPQLNGGSYDFSAAGGISTIPSLDVDCRGKTSNDKPNGVNGPFYQNLHDVTHVLDERSGATRHCFRRVVFQDWQYESNNESYHDETDTTVEIRTVDTAGTVTTDELDYFSNTTAVHPFQIGNFDLDGEHEVLFDGKIYDVEAGLFGTGLPVSEYSDFIGDFLFDMNGDGVSESIDSNRWHRRFSPESGYVNGVMQSRMYADKLQLASADMPFFGDGNYVLVGSVDINGDGINDVITFYANGSGTEQFKVSYGRGRSFEDVVQISGANVLEKGDLNRGTLRDINLDGRIDMIIHEGFDTVTYEHHFGLNRHLKKSESQEATIYLNTGDGFQVIQINGSDSFLGLVGSGDFDGDGLVDLVIEGDDGKILFGDGGVPNRMTAINETDGGRTEITYMPSSEEATKIVPSIQQVVSKIVQKNGVGDEREVTFTYVGGNHDYSSRQTLGYKTITANYEALPGETSGPTVTTIYLNDHIAQYGRVKSRTVTTDGTKTWHKVVNEWDVVDTGNGPYRSQLLSTRTSADFGDTLVETTVETDRNLYGEVTAIRDPAFTDGVGGNLATSDDTFTAFTFDENLTDYIVNRPATKIRNAGLTASTDRTTWLDYEIYHYDGLAFGQPPTRGNLTTLNLWDGDVNSSGIGEVLERGYGYDAYGNVTSEEDALNNTTTFAYDTSKHLFRTTETNALSQTVTTAWDTRCQAPTSSTNVNGDPTTFQYDIHCREIRRDLPGGQYEETSHISFGDPAAQHIERTMLSGGTVAASPGGSSGGSAANEVHAPVTSYSSRDIGTAVHPDDYTVDLDNSAWKQADFDITVTPTTIMTFEFSADVEGEIHSIGLDDNGYIGSKTLYQLFGTDSFGKHKDHDNLYTVGDPPRSYTLDIGLNSDFVGKTFDRVIFISGVNIGGGAPSIAESTFSNVEIGEPGNMTKLNFVSSGGSGGSSGGSGSAGNELTISRDYFDGFGETIRQTMSGVTSDPADDIVTLRQFDARGQLEWESIPLSSTEAASGTASTTQRSDFFYDALGRLIQTTNPDGSETTVAYTTKDIARYGPTIAVPTTQFSDENCYDSTSSTVCGEVWRLTDSRGNVIREDRNDASNDDVGPTGQWRYTEFTYDLNDRLTAVSDPSGASWAYAYDFFGNRLTADDPGLGNWTMSYDRNNNLKLQTDAKGQTIAFDYDDLNRVTKKTVTAGGSSTVTDMTYDEIGLGGDNLGQLTTVSVPGHTINYDYHITGQVQNETHAISDASGSSGSSGTTVVHAPLSGYSARDNGNASPSPDGYTVDLDGSAWKQADFDVTVTANTVLRFYFSAAVEDEIHSIGLDDNGYIGSTTLYQIHGTGSFGKHKDHDNLYTTGDPARFYEIDIGQNSDFVGKTFDRVVMISGINLTGGTSSAESTFSNIEIGEPGNMRALNFVTSGGGGSSGSSGTPTTYTIEYTYHASGALLDQRLPNVAGDIATELVGEYEYDAAGRPTALGSHITNIEYDLRSNPTRMDYANGVLEEITYDAARGWPTRLQVTDSGNVVTSWSDYTRNPTGQVASIDTERDEGDFAYTYDYAGRLLTATNQSALPVYDQTFAYNDAGSMVSNSHVGSYIYSTAAPDHAPAEIDASGTITTLDYDANGNMTGGLGGKVMTYDGENRPLSVTSGGQTTEYVYGADGSRLKKIEETGTANEAVTVFFGPVEIRNYGQGASEEVITYPHANLRLVNGAAEFLHRDQLSSIKLVTDSTGLSAATNHYKPFGEAATITQNPSVEAETKGFIGERFDAGAGLQYLNARYYDPELGMFVQSDWFDVWEQGVGTNRFAYSAADPVNNLDPNGNRSAAAQVQLDHYLEGNWDTYSGLAESLNYVGTLVSKRVLKADRISGLRSHFDNGELLTSHSTAILFAAGSHEVVVKQENHFQLMQQLAGGTIQNGEIDPRISFGGGGGKSTAPGKPINLPSARTAKIDMEHILRNHTVTGKGAQQSAKKDTFPDWMGPKQIERSIRQEYRSARRVRTQGDRVLVRTRSYEMWVNTKTKTIETAYPY